MRIFVRILLAATLLAHLGCGMIFGGKPPLLALPEGSRVLQGDPQNPSAAEITQPVDFLGVKLAAGSQIVRTGDGFQVTSKEATKLWDFDLPAESTLEAITYDNGYGPQHTYSGAVTLGDAATYGNAPAGKGDYVHFDAKGVTKIVLAEAREIPGKGEMPAGSFINYNKDGSLGNCYTPEEAEALNDRRDTCDAYCAKASNKNSCVNACMGR